MPVYSINPNNAGTIKLALDGVTPLVEYSCQITMFQIVPSQNTARRAGTYCGAPADTLGLSTWSVNVSWLQDWGAATSLSEFALTNDGELCDFEFTSANPTSCPSMTGTFQISAGAFGGPPGEAWEAGPLTWPMDSLPTLVEDVVV